MNSVKDLSKPDSSNNEVKSDSEDKQIIACFSTAEDKQVGPQLYIPLEAKKFQLQEILNSLQKDDIVPFSFKIKNKDGVFIEIEDTVQKVLNTCGDITSESVLKIYFFPLIPFRIKPVTRCTSSLEGHSEAVLCASFSPDSKFLATGSGDATIRIWDLMTETPIKTFKEHTNWVLSVEWSYDGLYLASGSMDTLIKIWNVHNVNEIKNHKAGTLKGHTKGITCLAWQPLHVYQNNQTSGYLASGSLDTSIRIWDVVHLTTLISLTSHTLAVTQIRFSGHSDTLYLYSSSRDTTVKLWNALTGELIQNMRGHGHWINCLATNTEWPISRGLINIKNGEFTHLSSTKEKIKMAKQTFEEYYTKFCGSVERIVSGSDDSTLIIWEPFISDQPHFRLVGHQNSISHVSFSPDCRYVASASFDKSIRLWDGKIGKYISVLRGHVGSVFRLAWHPDGRYLFSCSSDSTIKLWNLLKNKIQADLAGHCDQVYALACSNDGLTVASGSKDRFVKIWKY